MSAARRALIVAAGLIAGGTATYTALQDAAQQEGATKKEMCQEIRSLDSGHHTGFVATNGPLPGKAHGDYIFGDAGRDGAVFEVAAFASSRIEIDGQVATMEKSVEIREALGLPETAEGLTQSMARLLGCRAKGNFIRCRGYNKDVETEGAASIIKRGPPLVAYPGAGIKCSWQWTYERLAEKQGWRLFTFRAPRIIFEGLKAWAEATSGVHFFGGLKQIKSACLSRFTSVQCLELLGTWKHWKLANGNICHNGIEYGPGIGERTDCGAAIDAEPYAAHSNHGARGAEADAAFEYER